MVRSDITITSRVAYARSVDKANYKPITPRQNKATNTILNATYPLNKSLVIMISPVSLIFKDRLDIINNTRLCQSGSHPPKMLQYL